ncbi:MAG: polysaccharide deacetylase family protein [Candidatus Thiodiazotropha sp.]
MSETRKIIFSFDDGPAPESVLNNILMVLQKNGIKAEFYVLGSEVQKYPSAAKSITDRGHKIQNHSWSHADLAEASEDKVQSELERTQKVIKEVTGAKATKVRPPYGAGGWPKKHDPELAKVARNLSLTIHNWDIDTEDWKKPRGIGVVKIEKLKKQFNQKRGKPRLNVLMHVQQETARDLPGFIQYLKESGFTFSVPSN